MCDAHQGGSPLSLQAFVTVIQRMLASADSGFQPWRLSIQAVQEEAQREDSSHLASNSHKSSRRFLTSRKNQWHEEEDIN